MRQTIVRLLLAFGLLLPFTSLSRAEDGGHVKAGQDIIAQQIEAMRRDDGAKAFSFAAPEVQLKFQTPAIFMQMVKQGYAPVYRPQSYQFQQSQEVNGVISQLVDLTTSNGEYWIAQYQLVVMQDGTIRIVGCMLKKRDGVGA